jgi:hypothetical protein
MSKRIKHSSGDEKHPYMKPINWINGNLCFWRRNPQMYTDESIKYFEDFVAKMKREEDDLGEAYQPQLKSR